MEASFSEHLTEPAAESGRNADQDPTACVVTALDECVDLHVMHQQFREQYPFLLQSTARNSTLGQYDVLFASSGENLVLDRTGNLQGPVDGDSFLTALDNWWQRERCDAPDSDLPFLGGWFLYLGYELAAEIEPALELGTDEILPVAFAARCHAAIIREHSSAACWLVTEPGIDDSPLLADIEACHGKQEQSGAIVSAAPRVIEEQDAPFKDSVKRAKDFISSGDVYQANLSRGWSATVDATRRADAIYAALSQSNPAPFAGLARWHDATIISSSPERLLRLRHGVASTRPIAGTRPRSDDRSKDDTLSAELFAHPKERAEHVMLIDLERNDLGRICEPGTVEVDEMMVLETYAHVHHIVSNVRGRLRDQVTPGAAIRAVFPGGTITGCPKVRCMQIIQALESGPRGAYTGSFGYLNRDGSLDLNILIRTMVLRGSEVTFRAGSGIVADSDPDAELDETRAKAKGMLKALSQ